MNVARVLYVGGWGRSGSTLLDRILGQVPGFASLGEVRELWQRGVAEDRPCGCGEPFHACPFWSEVGRRAFGGWDAAAVSEATSLRYSIDRPWLAPMLLRASPSGKRSRSVTRYRELLGALYGALHEVSGADVLVDSSKLPMHALLLAGRPEIDLRLVHLVRDSRGVAFSWSKHVTTPAIGESRARLERYDPISAAARYVLYNALTGLVGRRRVPCLLLRYEDLVASPRAAVERVLIHAGASPGPEPLAFLRNGHALLKPNHTVDGNPVRFAVGDVPIAADEEWRTRMSKGDRFVVTALTSPLLRRYGYLAPLRRDR